MSPRSQSRLALFALLGGATGIGFAPVLVRLTDTGPSATAFYRVLGALPLLWFWVAVDRRMNPSTPQPHTRRHFALLALAGVCFAADLSIWHWSLRFTTVADSTLLTNVAPIFVTLGAWIFFQERVTRRFVAGMALAIAGGAMLVGVSRQGGSHPILGDVLAVLAAVFYGAYLLAVKHLRRTFATPTIMAYSSMVSCPSFALIALALGDAMVPSTTQGWLAIVGLALVCHVGGQTLITYGFGHLPASFSSVSLLWQPVVAAGAAWLFLGESLRWTQGVGGSIVLAGIALASSVVGSQSNPAAVRSGGSGDSGCNRPSGNRS